MKLDHIGIEVLDLFTVELFYRTALGFAPRYRYVSGNSPGLRTVFLERGGVSLNLENGKEPRGRPRSRDRHSAGLGFTVRWTNHGTLLSCDSRGGIGQNLRWSRARGGPPLVRGGRRGRRIRAPLRARVSRRNAEAAAGHRRRLPRDGDPRPGGERRGALGADPSRAAIPDPRGDLRPRRHASGHRGELLRGRPARARGARDRFQQGGQAALHRRQHSRHDDRCPAALRSAGDTGRAHREQERSLPRDCAGSDRVVPGNGPPSR